MELAEKQHGVFTGAQATGLGFTREAIRHRLRAGRWEQAGVNVYRVTGSPPTWEQRLLGLVLTAGPAAAASHGSAAALFGIPGFSRQGRVEITTPRPRRHRSQDQIVHRWRPFPAHHLTVVDGIVTTRVGRTLCDLAGVLHPDRTERVIDTCLSLGLVTPGTLQAAFYDLAGRGRKGTAVLRRVLVERCVGYVAPSSELEARFRDLVRNSDLPEPVRQLNVGDDESWIGRVDAAYPSARLVVELDSALHHSSKLDREADEARDRRLRHGGWRIVRFTWDDLASRPEWVLSELTRLISSAAA
jgi:very-short-patch-repair endonuclease